MQGSRQKVVLITGGGKRVGKVIAHDLARDHSVAVHYRNSSKEARQTVEEINQAGGMAIEVQADLSEEKAVERMFEICQSKLGGIDAIINMASTWLEKRLEETSTEDVLSEIKNNAVSAFHCCKVGGLLMAKQPTGGAIILVGDWALCRPYLHHSAYFAGKGSLPTLTRTFARELAERNSSVRVNCVLPGPVLSADDAPQEVAETNRQLTLLKRSDEPAWLAHAVRFLVENQFVTGVVLPVDAGRTIFSPGDGSE